MVMYLLWYLKTGKQNKTNRDLKKRAVCSLCLQSIIKITTELWTLQYVQKKKCLICISYGWTSSAYCFLTPDWKFSRKPAISHHFRSTGICMSERSDGRAMAVPSARHNPTKASRQFGPHNTTKPTILLCSKHTIKWRLIFCLWKVNTKDRGPDLLFKATIWLCVTLMWFQ